MRSYWIFWGVNEVSCFRLNGFEQALAIAQQYPNFRKIEIH